MDCGRGLESIGYKILERNDIRHFNNSKKSSYAKRNKIVKIIIHFY